MELLHLGGELDVVAGSAFAERAQRILDSLSEAAAEARVLGTAGPRTLRVGMFPEAAGEISPLIFATYRRAFPHTTLELVELSMVNQVDAVTGGEVDVAILRLPQENSGLALLPMFAEPRYAGLPSAHPLGHTESLSVDDLVNDAFVIPAAGAPKAWTAYWRFDERRGHPGRVAASAQSIAESLWAIAYQGAVDSVPGSAARLLRPSGVSWVRLRDAEYSTVALASRRGDRRAHVRALGSVTHQVLATQLDLVPEAEPVLS